MTMHTIYVSTALFPYRRVWLHFQGSVLRSYIINGEASPAGWRPRWGSTLGWEEHKAGLSTIESLSYLDYVALHHLLLVCTTTLPVAKTQITQQQTNYTPIR